VTGTVTYRTAAGGSKTVFVIEPVSKVELAKIAEAIAKIAEAKLHRVSERRLTHIVRVGSNNSAHR
jgi:hypothetical protein